MGSLTSKPAPAPAPAPVPVPELLPASNSYLVSKTNQFLQQKADYDWFMTNKGGAHGEDSFQRRVVLTTFPSSLTKADFEDYVENKFSDQEEKIKKQIKALFHAIQDCDMSKNITFNYETDGQISAVLTQMLFERLSESATIKVSVGYTKCIRRAKTGSHLDCSYWKGDEDKVTSALQFLYGSELRKELILIK